MPTYEVFARRGHDNELERLGALDTTQPSTAQSIAWYTFDGAKATELWLVPREAIIRLERPDDVTAEFILEDILGATTRHDLGHTEEEHA